VVVQAILQNAAEHKRAKLILNQLVIVIEDVLDERVLSIIPAVFYQALDHSAGVLVDAALADVCLNLRKELVEQLLILVLVHDGDELLDDMVPMEVEH
jgi:hypothetical protein